MNNKIEKNEEEKQQQNLNHQLAIIQPSFNSIRKQSIASIIKKKRNKALSSIIQQNNHQTSKLINSNTINQSTSRQHTRIILPKNQNITSETTTTTTNDSSINHQTHLNLKQQNHHQHSSSKSLSKIIPPSIKLVKQPLEISDPTLSQVIMTPTTEEWWSFGGISYKTPKTKSGLSSPTTSTQRQAQAEEKIQIDEEEEEEDIDNEEEEEEDEVEEVDDQSDHTGSSSSGSYQCTHPEPSSPTTTTPDNTLEPVNHHHLKITHSPSNPISAPDSPSDFSTVLISTEPEPSQALTTLTSVNGIINVPSSPVLHHSNSGAKESHVSFPKLTAMSSNSVGRASQYPNSPLTSTALLSSFLDRAPPSIAPRPCSLLHDGIVRKSIDPRSYSAMTGHRNLDSFILQSNAGSGAYGIVKHAREKDLDGQPIGPPLMIKYIIKQRILADCWKRHKVLGPIPVEIHVLDHLRRVNSRPSMITMAKKFIQNTSLNRGSTCLHTIPSRLELVEYFTQQEELNDIHHESHHQSTQPHQQRKGHPNICGILDYFEDPDYYYLVMPRFGHGKDLFEYIETAPDGLPREEVRNIFGQIVDGVAFLHERNIVHRDLKDENVILDGNGNAQLIDFGSASYVREGCKFQTFSGTLDFAAPEVLKGVPHGGKEIDIWALGVILYVLITGECPFWNPEEASKGIGSGTRSRSKLEELLSNTPNGSAHQDKVSDSEVILDLLDHCLNLDPDQRPSVETICWHKFFLPEAGWIGTQIPKTDSLKTCLTPSILVDSHSATNTITT